MNKLVIFGVGLIGGSVALALKQAHAVKHIVGIGRDGDHLQTALELGVIDEAQTSLASALHEADMVLIAAPVAQTFPILQAIAPHLSPSTIVTDAGSTKSDIVAYAETALGDRHHQFVPGHPIAGAEKSGVTAARADLFSHKNVVLTPFSNTQASDIAKVQTLWEACGANVIKMTAAEHDRIFAAVSHLPHLLAFALVNELASRPNADQLFDFAASGFRDFSRIAGSHPEMWRDISLANQSALLDEIDAYQTQLSHVRELLQTQDGAGLQQLFERASHARNAWARHKKY